MVQNWWLLIYNLKQLEAIRISNFNKLDLAFRPKINALEVDIGNSLRHEMAKMICVFLIRKGVPCNLLPEYFTRFKKNWYDPTVAKCFALEFGQTFQKTDYRPSIVTEARFKNGKRCDVYDLDTDEKVEIETKKKVTKPDSITIRI